MHMGDCTPHEPQEGGAGAWLRSCTLSVGRMRALGGNTVKAARFSIVPGPPVDQSKW